MKVKMGKIDTYLIIVILLVGVNPATGFSQNGGKSDTLPAELVSHQEKQMVPVQEALLKLEQHYDVIFLYDSQLINNKRVQYKEPLPPDVLEAANELLQGYEVRVVRLNDHSYAVLPETRPQKSVLQRFQIEVEGTVTDASTGETLPGVNILVKGTATGASTDQDGNFELEVPSLQDTLVVTYIGYQRQEVPINGRTELDIQLNPEAIMGEEMVVVGYGMQEKKLLTSSISRVSANDIQSTTNVSLAQKLQGKVAGLQIRQNSGAPGEFNTSINIRGYGGEPLYIIDGIPRGNSNDFQQLNPDDIESISVLKDASAAIYGVRAGNGVIIVTTKKGQEGGTKFNYQGTFGIQAPTNVPEMANASQWAQMRNDAAILGGGNPFYSEEILQNYITGAPGYESTNWYDRTMKNYALQSEHNLSVSGGSDDIQYFVSGGFFDQNGLIKTDDINYDRFNLRSNITASISDNLEAKVLLAGRLNNRDIPGENFFNIFKGTRVALPTQQPYANGNSEYPATVSSSVNPVAVSDRDLTGYNEFTDKNFRSSATLTYEAPFLDGLSFQAIGSYDNNSYQNKYLFKSFELFDYNSDNNSFISQEQRSGNSFILQHNSDFNRLTLQGQATYETSLNDVHNFKSVLVYEQQQTWSRWTEAQRYYDFFTNDQINFAGLDNQQTGGLEEETGRMSFVGRFNYDYKDKYLFEFSFRQDGSYRYSPENRWGFFPVGSVGWRISEEPFMDNLDWISNLKLRASYGVVGEDAGEPFQYVRGFSVTGGGGYEFSNGSYTTGAASPSIVNQDLSWFTSKIADIGITVGLWEERFNLEFDAYQRNRDGLLAYRNASLPNTFGGTLPQENLNSDQVRGFDLKVSYNKSTEGYRYGISANFNYARTKNTYIERGPFLNSMDRWRNGSTDRYNDIVWGYNYVGQFQSNEEIINAPVQNGDLGNTRELPGDFRYEDWNDDGVINGKDMQPMFWNGTPKMFYGLTLTGGWKGFDVNLLFQGAAKYSVRFQEVYAQMLWQGGNTPAYFFDRWHKTDPYDPNSEWVSGKWPATRLIQDVGMMYAESSRWRRDASYVRFKSAELGYTFQGSSLQDIGLDEIRVYGTAHNIFTITDPFVKAFDPEKIEGLYNAGYTYPLQRSFNLGINISF